MNHEITLETAMILEHPPQMSLDMAQSGEDAPCCQDCQREVVAAKREIGAFVTAALTLYGMPEALHAANDWVELAESDAVPSVDGCWNWRKITIAAASRLATRQLLRRNQEVSRGK